VKNFVRRWQGKERLLSQRRSRQSTVAIKLPC
jgi:hypothetical protein